MGQETQKDSARCEGVPQLHMRKLSAQGHTAGSLMGGRVNPTKAAAYTSQVYERPRLGFPNSEDASEKTDRTREVVQRGTWDIKGKGR